MRHHRAWDLISKAVVWHICPPNIPQRMYVSGFLFSGVFSDKAMPSGSSAIYLDFNAIVVNTIQEGPYLFKLGSVKPVRKWDLDAEANIQYPSQISFLHDGQAIVSGSSTGNVCIWQTGSRDLYQILPHNGMYSSPPCISDSAKYTL